MSEHPFHKFLDLIHFDQNMHSMEQRRDSLATELEQLHNKVQEFHDQLAVSKKNVIELRKAVDALELDMKELDAQQKDKKAQLEDSSKYKEYQSLQHEFERLQALQSAKEFDLLQAWKILELAEQKLVVDQQEADAKLIQLHASMETNKQECIDLEKELVMQATQREAKEKIVPSEWIEKYNVMRARVSDPVVEIEANSCGACFQDLTHQEMIRLKRGALLPCKGCYRLLYIQEAIDRGDLSEQQD